MATKKVYVIAMEGEGPTGCEWRATREERNALAGTTGAQVEVLFDMEVDDTLSNDEITSEVDAACWDKAWDTSKDEEEGANHG